METLLQRVFRAVIATIIAGIGGFAILYYGYLNYSLVQQYWKYPAAIMVTFLLYKDIKIIAGKD